MEEEDGFELDTAEKMRFLTARKGDGLCGIFQCEVCHFRNVKGRDPVESKGLDTMLQYYMQRANLDSFWSRQPSTVAASADELRRDLKLAGELGLAACEAFPRRGPFPVEDSVGMAQACVMLRRTQMTGKAGLSKIVRAAREKKSFGPRRFHLKNICGPKDTVLWIHLFITH